MFCIFVCPANREDLRGIVMSFMQFTEQITTNPLLALAVVLTMGVILVNGWTDAPMRLQPVL